MLTKKLKKTGKECRATEDPVLLTLATYVDHVANYLERAKDESAKAKEYGDALARLDLSAVIKAHEALTVIESTVEQEASEVPVAVSNKEEEKAAKKAKKKAKKKAEESQAVAAPPTPQEVDTAVEPPADSSSNEEEKKGKKAKKNKKKDK